MRLCERLKITTGGITKESEQFGNGIPLPSHGVILHGQWSRVNTAGCSGVYRLNYCELFCYNVLIVDPRREQTLPEEMLNTLTCGAGLCLSVAAAALLVIKASIQGDAWCVVSASIYGASLVLLFFFSTLYHSIRAKKAKQILEIFDHCTIYLLIAGTYTPFTLVTLRGPWGWSLFGSVWGLALCGILFKIFFINRFRVVSAVVYLLMGWAVATAIQPLTQHLAPLGVGWLLAGGIIYSVGLIFYAWKKLYFHAIWHFFVLAGAACHFFAVFCFVLPA